MGVGEERSECTLRTWQPLTPIANRPWDKERIPRAMPFLLEALRTRGEKPFHQALLQGCRTLAGD